MCISVSAYINHLVKCEDLVGPMLITRHNLHYYQELMAGLRGAIEEGTLDAFADNFHEQYASGDIGEVHHEGTKDTKNL
jgi:queuine tRNA-ribosyltransferase